ncbi:MAG TPA: TonB family protein [Pyrinomonadaceae bacterium]|nr:TonB family protein [Pyrinomonadaceae bacterium]
MRRKALFTVPWIISAVILGLGSASSALGQTAQPGGISQTEIDRIVRTFTAKETQFRNALNTYAFKRDAIVQSLGMGGQITGEYHRVSYFTFDDSGNRFEKISFFPMPSFGGVTQEDIDDLGGINPFALEPSKIDRYTFRYVGKEKIDELNLFVFDVTPKVIPDPKKTKERLFTGRVWVDDQDFMIVKTKGKGVPETKINKFPIVETYREQIDGRYWFPTYSYADEELIYDSGDALHIRLQVKYSDFVKGRATVTVTDVGEASPGITDSTTNSSDPSKEIDGGVLNSKALDLPKPKYPEAARAAKITGRVTVKILLDEKGNIVSAEAIDGPQELRAAAVEAARKARFTLTLIGTRPVKVFGLLTYDFAPEPAK